MKLIVFTIIILLLIILTILFLEDNKMLFYATGTKSKAFINSTWEMSPQEIERSNKIKLQPVKYDLLPISPLYEDDYPAVFNSKRYKTLFNEDLKLWGFPARIEYAFFDNKLFEYTIIIKTYDHQKINNLIYSSISKKYKLIEDPKKPNYIKSQFWKNNDIKIYYWLSQKEDKLYVAGLKFSYLPMFGKMKAISLKEQEEIF